MKSREQLIPGMKIYIRISNIKGILDQYIGEGRWGIQISPDDYRYYSEGDIRTVESWFILI